MKIVENREKTALIWIIIAIILLFFIGRFIYFNIIVPAPYKEVLKECLEATHNLEKDEALIEVDKCFEKYPHFN